MAGTLFVVATPIGNHEDITARALRVQREVALIAAEDTRRTAHLLTRYGITTKTTSLHEHNEHGKTASLIARLQAGDSIAIVSDAGTPTISDPGVHFIAQARAEGIRIEPIPGPSALIAALSVAGVRTDAFTFLGFPPIRSNDRKTWFENLAAAGRTVVFYEAPHRVSRTLRELRDRIGDANIFIARELTKSYETLVKCHISEAEVLMAGQPGEFTIVVEIGQTPYSGAITAAERPTPSDLAREFGQLTQNTAVTRRRAIAQLGRKHGLSARETYAALEQAKKSGS